MIQATNVLASNNHLGETPIWSGREESLYWVNCEQPPEIHRWHPATGQHDVWPMPARVGGIALREAGGLLVVLSHGIYDFDTVSGSLSLKVPSPLPDYISLHECACDQQGRLWVGSYDHRFNPQARDFNGGSIFRLDGEQLTPVIDGISVANGLAISPDGKTLYVSDSPTRRVDAYDLNPETGELANGRPFVALQDGEGYVDGANVDAQGGYWLAAVGAGTLRRYNPDGTLDALVRLEASNPTKAAFGGPGLDTLYITTTQLLIGPSCEANGDLFAAETGYRGVAEPLFKE